MHKLRNFYLFKKLSDSLFNRLTSIAQKRSFKKGNILFFEGERPKHLILLTKGAVQIYKTDPKGNKIILHTFFPTSLIAEIANFENMPYPATAEFVTDGEALLIDYEAFEREFLKDPEVSFAIIRSLTDKIRYLEDVITSNLVLNSTARVAKFIYEHEDEFITLKKSEIAYTLNITPETLSRILKKFKALKLIEKDNGSYKVINKEGLKSLYE